MMKFFLSNFSFLTAKTPFFDLAKAWFWPIFLIGLTGFGCDLSSLLGLFGVFGLCQENFDDTPSDSRKSTPPKKDYTFSVTEYLGYRRNETLDNIIVTTSLFILCWVVGVIIMKLTDPRDPSASGSSANEESSSDDSLD